MKYQKPEIFNVKEKKEVKCNVNDTCYKNFPTKNNMKEK